MPGESVTTQESFDKFYCDYHRLVYTVAYGMLGNREDAEDVGVAVFTKKWFNRHRFDPAKATLKTWIKSNTIRYCIDILRNRANMQRTWIELDENLPTEGFDNAVIDRIMIDRILDGLNAFDRSLIYLRCVENSTWEDLAAHFNVKVHTLRSQVARIQRQLNAARAD